MFLAWKRVSCILRYLGRGTGAPPLFLLLSLKGWQPPFCLSALPSRTRFYSIHEGGDHEPIHERHSSSTSDPGESRRSDNFSLLRPRSVSVWTRWEGDNARESRATVWESSVKQSNLAFTSLQEMHVNTGRISRNCFWGEVFHLNLFPCSSDLV